MLIISRRDVKIIVVGVIIGRIFQIACSEYLKWHSERLNRSNPEQSEAVEPALDPKKPRTRFRRFPRGGAVLETELVVAIISLIAEKGWLLGGVGGIAAVAASKVSSKALSTLGNKVLRNALIVNHSDYEKKKYFLPLQSEPEVSLEICERPFQYLFQIITAQDISYSEKFDKTFKILTTYLDLDPKTGRIRFVLCMVSILCFLFDIKDIKNLHLLMQNLLKGMKNGRISKRLGRLIRRRLLKKGFSVDPELIDAVRV